MMYSNGVVRSVKDKKCYTNSKILFFVVLLTLKLGVHSFAQQTDEFADLDTVPFDVGLGYGEKNGVVDNIEVHEVYTIDGVMHEGHPILMYKEDFVNEDFVKKDIAQHPVHNNTEYNDLKQEKIYFDILPQRPILISDDDVDESDTKLVAELVPLVNKLEGTENNNLVSEKGIYSNRIKKISRRQKRGIKNQNPYNRGSFYTSNKASYHYSTQALKSVFYTTHPQFHQNSNPNFAINRHPVQGKPPSQPHEIGTRGDFDDQKTSTTADTPSRPSPLSLWHDSNPDNFDFTQYDNHPPGRQSTSNKQNDSTATSRKVSNCVWAIVNCCAENDNKVRYYCFEEFSCHGAFWGLNPCADKVRDNAISYLDNAYA